MLRTDHGGGGETALMGDAECELAHPRLAGQFGGTSGELEPNRPIRLPAHLDRGKADALSGSRERLDRGLLGGEAGRKPLRLDPARVPAAIVYLTLRVYPREVVVAVLPAQALGHRLDGDQVEADSQRHTPLAEPLLKLVQLLRQLLRQVVAEALEMLSELRQLLLEQLCVDREQRFHLLV